MKTVFLRFLQLLVLCSCQFSFAQWMSSTLPDFNQVDYTFHMLVSTDNRLIAGTSNGIYISDNDGALWQPIYSGITTPNIPSLIYDGQAVIAGGQGGRVFVSTNNGDTWQTVTNGIFAGSNIFHFGQSGSTIFAISEDDKLYASQDHGQTWQQNTTAPSFDYTKLFVKGTKIFLMGTAGNIYSSSDNGISWQASNAGLPSAIINAITTDGTNLWAAIETPTSGAVYKSTDDGVTWTSSWNGVPGAWMGNVIYLPSGKLLASTKSMGNLYSSLDGGVTWTNTGNSFTYIKEHVVHNNKLYIASWQNGIYYSSDDAQSWVASNHGFEAVVSKLYKIDENIYGGGNSLNYVTYDEAQSWSISSLPNHAYIQSTYTSGSRTYAGTGLGLFYTDDNGVSWTQVTSPDLPASNFEVRGITMNGNTIYLATNFGVYVSTDLIQWQTINNGFSSTDINKVAVAGSKLFALSNFKLYESTDNGQSWLLNASMAAQNYNGFYFHESKIYLFGQQLKVSTDGGANFSVVNKPGLSNILDFKIHNDIMFVVGNNNNVFVSYDQAATWSTFSTGLITGQSFLISSIQFTNNYIVIASQGPFDVFRRPLSDLGITCPNIGALTGPSTVCNGQTGVSYSIPAQIGVSYNWSVSGATIVSGNGTPSIQVNFGASNSTITIVQSKTGCADKTASLQISVTTPPAATISGPAALCGTSTGTYTVAAYPNASYVWTVPAGATFTGQGTRSVEVTFANTGGTVLLDITSNGCVVPQASLDVALNETPIITPAGPVNIPCAQAVSVTLTAPAGYVYYRWFRNSAQISGNNLNTFIANSTGEYTVTVSNDNSCYSSMAAAVTITQPQQPSQAPVLSPNGGVFIPCGKSLSLIVTNQNLFTFNQYKWYKDGVLIPGATIPTLTVTEPGSYTVAGSLDGSCYSLLSAVVAASLQTNTGIGINTSTGNNTIACGGSIDLIATSGFTSYRWYKDGAVIPGATTNTLPGVTNAGKYEVETYNATCTSAKVARDIYVGNTPSISVMPPINGTINCGQTTTLTTTAVLPFYRWYRNGVVIPNSNSSSIIVSSTGDYTVTGSSDGVCFTVPGVPVHVNVVLSGVTPSLTLSKTPISCGETATLNVWPVNYAYYKWYLNGQEYVSTTVPTIQTNTQGQYTVAVSNDNSCYSMISNNVSLVITAQPATLEINNGLNTFQYNYNSGNNTLQKTGVSANFDSYQWQFNPYYTSTDNWIDIAGATTASHNFTNVNGRYRLKGIFNGCPASFSNVVNVFITNITLDVSPAQANAIMCSANAKLTATPGFQNYAWKNVLTNTQIAVTTAPELILANYNLGSGTYSVTVYGTDQYGVQYSSSSGNTHIKVYNNITPTLSVPTLACAGTSGTINITNPSGVYSSYEWKNNLNVTISTDSELLVNNAGTYTLNVIDFAGCSATVTAPVTGSSSPADFTPVLAAQNGNTQFCIGGSLTLMVSNIASIPPGSYEYHWYKNGLLLSSGSASTLTVSVVGTYSVQIVPLAGTTSCIAYSNSVSVSNFPSIDVSVQSPVENKFCIGMAQKLVAASGAGYTYQWGRIIPSLPPPPTFAPINGATSQQFEPTSNQDIAVRITDANGCVATSSTISVKMVNTPEQPVIYQVSGINYSLAPAQITTCSTQITLSAVNTLNGELPFGVSARWYKNGQMIAGATGRSYSVISSGTYTLEYTIGNCTRISSAVQINMISPPAATITFPNVSPTPVGSVVPSCSSNRTIFRGPDAPAGQTYTYKWFSLTSPNQNINGLTPVSMSQEITPIATNMFYKLEVSNGTCSTLTSAYQITNVPAPTAVPTVADKHLCGPGSITFTVNGILQPNWKYRWIEASTGTVVQENTSATYTTPVLSTNTGYQVMYVDGSCPSIMKAPANAFIHIPAPPVVPDVSRCGPGTVALSASGNSLGAYAWYTSSTAPTPIATGANYTTPQLSVNTTYYVATYKTVNGQPCYSVRTAVNAIIKPLPVISVTSSLGTICRNASVTLTASGADNYIWRSAGTQVGTGSTYAPSTSSVGSINLQVEGTTNGCIGNANYSSVVNELPLFTVNSSNGTTICTNASTRLTIVGGTENRYWYVSPSTTSFSSAAFVDVTPATNTTYIAAVVNSNGCRRELSIPITVVAPPAAPIVNTVAPVCSLQTVTLAVQSSSPSLTYRWYDENNILLYTGATYTPVITRDRVFKVTASQGNCSSAPATVSVHMIQVVAAPDYSGEVCGTTNASFTVQPSFLNQKYNWFANPSGGTSLAQGVYYSSIVTEGTSAVFYVEASKTEQGVTCKAPVRGVVTVTAKVPNVLTVTASSPEVCYGGYVDLAVTGAKGYKWSHGLGNQSSVRVSFGDGNNSNYDITYSVTGYDYPCIVTGSVTVKVKQRPAAPVITADKAAVCGFEPVTYTGANALSGTQWYHWSITNTFTGQVREKISASASDNTWVTSHNYWESWTMLSIEDVNGCKTTTTKRMTVNEANAIYFDGVDDVVTKPIGAEDGDKFMMEGNEFSLSATIKPATPPVRSSQTIVSKRTNAQNGYMLSLTDNGTRIELQINGYSYKSQSISSQYLFDNRCHSIGATVKLTRRRIFNNTYIYFREVRFFVDRSSLGTVIWPVTNVKEINSPLLFGNDFAGQAYKGTLVSVSLWNYRLTDREMTINIPPATFLYRFWSTDSETSTNQEVPCWANVTKTYAYKAILGTSASVESSDPVRLCFSACPNLLRVGELADEDQRRDIDKEWQQPEAIAQPNPFETSTTIALTGFTAESVDLVITDLHGKELWRKEKHPVMELLEIGEGLNNGIFILKVIGRTETQTIKIIKTK